MTGEPVSSDEFCDQLRPGAEALQELVEAGRAFRTSIEMPASNSVAMSELSKESRFAGVWNSEPANHAHALAGFLAFAGEDQLLTLAHVLQTDFTPLYAPMTLVRAALEACGRAIWLLEVPITVEQRISRMISIEMKSRGERLGFAAGVDSGHASVRAEHDELKAARKRLGLPYEECPAYEASIELAINFEPDSVFGSTVAKLLAGGSHSELHAITSPIDRANVQRDPVTGTVRAPFMIDLHDLYRTMALGALGYRHLLAAQVLLFGWPSPELGSVVERTMGVLAARLPEVAN